MTIRINIKPIVVWGNSKQEIINEFRSVYNTVSVGGSCYRRITNEFRDEGTMFGFNFEKHNSIVKQTKFKNGKTKKMEVVKRAFWKAYVYRFDKSLPINIIQHARHFTVENND